MFRLSTRDLNYRTRDCCCETLRSVSCKNPILLIRNKVTVKLVAEETKQDLEVTHHDKQARISLAYHL